MEAFGQIDVVFCNAGISTPAVSISEVTLHDWNRALSTNLTASFLCSREAFRYMSKGSSLGRGQGGRIVLNGSISAHVPRPNSSPYTSSKHGVSGLAKSLSLDGRKHDIIVSQIDIGNAASEITGRMARGPGVEQADGSFKLEPLMDVKHAANEVVHIVEMPLSVNVQTVTIQASKMPNYVGRG
ncbi:hypothetical protein CBS101457_005858 [Exobasidium rhododendri]|nr:hypothetical protein CBS101457_005858 [Exobasidium rhododendri]